MLGHCLSWQYDDRPLELIKSVLLMADETVMVRLEQLRVIGLLGVLMNIRAVVMEDCQLTFLSMHRLYAVRISHRRVPWC